MATNSKPRNLEYGRSFLLALLIVFLLGTPAKALTAPSVSPSTGSFTTQQTVTITGSGGTIYYTLDGTQPTSSSPAYSSAFTISTPTQINAVVYSAPNYSPVTTVYLDVDPNLAPVLQTGLILRLRAGFGVVASGSPTYVSQWNDLSGQGNNASGTSGSEPTFVPSAQKCLPAVKFNGSSQFLSFPSLSTTSFTGLTIFVVSQPSAITGGARIIDFGDGASGNDLLLQVSSSGSYGQFWTYSGTSGTDAQSAGTLTANQAELLEAVQSANSATFYINGAAGSTNTSMSSIPSTTLTSNFLCQASNGGNYYQGTIAEVLAYSSALSTSQRVAIESYLVQKYQALSVVPETPIFSVSGGTTSSPVMVLIASQPDTLTFFTTDGTTPSTGSRQYNGNPITIAYSQTLKAISVKSGVQSSVASATYTLDSGLWPAPSSSDPATPSINLQLPAPGI